MERIIGFNEIFNEEVSFEEFIIAMELLTKVEEQTKNLSNSVKCSFLCMLFDILFEERSVEIAERCVENIKIVNEHLGTL